MRPAAKDPTGADMLAAIGAPGIPRIRAAEPVELLPSESRPPFKNTTGFLSHREPASDPCPTPIAQAIHPRSEPPPESTPVEIDQRIDRLLAENLALMSERKVLHEVADLRSLRCSQLLASAREGHQLAVAYVEACDAYALAIEKEAPLPDMKVSDDAYAALKSWAAKPL